MKKMILTTLLLTLTLVVRAETSSSSGDPSAGTTKFVSDELTIMLRAGPSNKHKIIRALTTGTKLQAFESENSYERVRTHTGIEGWVLSQHLTDKPLAKHLLTAANEKLAQLEAKNQQLQEQIKQLRDSYNKLNTDYRDLDNSKTDMQAELDRIRNVAAQPLKLSEEKHQLSLQTESLESQLNELKEELTGLRNNTHKQWFLTGAAVVLLGILIGLTIPRLRRSRRSDWSSI